MVKNRSKQILEELHPDSSFAFSDCWFQAFKRRFRISLRRATNTCQRNLMTSDCLFSSFIKEFAVQPPNVLRLARWESGQNIRLPTWTKHHYRLHSLTVRPMQTKEIVHVGQGEGVRLGQTSSHHSVDSIC